MTDLQNKSDKLRHFPELDPKPNGENSALRAQIQQQVNDYLMGGGEITAIDSGDSAELHYPVKRTRQAQIDFIRRRDFIRRKKDEELL